MFTYLCREQECHKEPMVVLGDAAPEDLAVMIKAFLQDAAAVILVYLSQLITTRSKSRGRSYYTGLSSTTKVMRPPDHTMQYPQTLQCDARGGRHMLHVMQYLSIDPSGRLRTHCPLQFCM